MIKYNQLSAEGKLHIDIEVEEKEYFDNVYIAGVRIDTSETYDKEHPYEEYKQEPAKQLIVDLVIPHKDLKKEILFITPVISGYPSEETPCGQDVCDKAYIYCDTDIRNKGIAYLKELGNNCQTPKGFIDFILRTTALDLSLQTCNYNDAAKYWKLLKGNTVKVRNKNCGCHG